MFSVPIRPAPYTMCPWSTGAREPENTPTLPTLRSRQICIDLFQSTVSTLIPARLK